MLKFAGIVNLPLLGMENLEEDLSYFSKFVNTVELVLDYPLGPHTITTNQVEKIKQLLDSLNLEALIHAPFTYTFPLSQCPKIFKIAIDDIRITADISNKLNVKFITAHLGLLTLYQYNKQDELIDRAVKHLEKIAKEYSVNIGIENLGYSSRIRRSIPNTMEELMRIKNSELFITFDTGHTFLTGIDPIRFMDEFGKKIKHIHINDSNNEAEHLCIGTGKIDFDPIFKKLKAMKYQDHLTIEVFPRTDFEKSLDLLKKIDK